MLAIFGPFFFIRSRARLHVPPKRVGNYGTDHSEIRRNGDKVRPLNRRLRRSRIGDSANSRSTIAVYDWGDTSNAYFRMRDGAPVKTQSPRKNADGVLGGRQLVGGIQTS